MSISFQKAALFGNYISKSHAKDIFKLLYEYNDISASEAASRLGLHIRTVQDFFEAMSELDILDKNEVYEKKRPYFRYTLKSNRIQFEINLEEKFKKEKQDSSLDLKIREKKNSGIGFTSARGSRRFSTLSILISKGREREERKINLTDAQGKFLYNLPFPDGDYETIKEIIEKSETGMEHASEILNIVDLLIEYNTVDVVFE